MIFKLFNIFKNCKLKFFNPKNCDILIFDDESSDLIKKLLQNYKFFTLKTRLENIDTLYLSTKIIILSFFYYRGNFLSSYLISLISIVKPKIVITYIDNSLKFSEVALRFKKINKSIKFIAIQNGSRYEVLENNYLFKKKIFKENLNNKFYIPIFLTLGNYEKKIYKKLNVKFLKNYPVGSLALEQYTKFKKQNKIKIKKKKQICILSDHGAWHPKMIEVNNDLEKNFVLLTEFCIKFAKKFNYKILVCQKRAKGRKKIGGITNKNLDFYSEQKAFKKYLTKKNYSYFKKFLLKRDNVKYKTYLKMEESEVLVSTMSTMLRENLFLRNKILAANLTGEKIYNFPLRKFFSFNDNSYDRFEKKLLSIINMSTSDYFKKGGKNIDYCIMKNKLPSKTIMSVVKKCL